MSIQSKRKNSLKGRYKGTRWLGLFNPRTSSLWQGGFYIKVKGSVCGNAYRFIRSSTFNSKIRLHREGLPYWTRDRLGMY